MPRLARTGSTDGKHSCPRPLFLQGKTLSLRHLQAFKMAGLHRLSRILLLIWPVIEVIALNI